MSVYSSKKKVFLLRLNLFLILILIIFSFLYVFKTENNLTKDYTPAVFDGKKIIPGFFGEREKN